jgi:hypothetical protein
MEHTQPPSRPQRGRPDLKLIVNKYGIQPRATSVGRPYTPSASNITEDTYFSVLIGNVCNSLQTTSLRHFLGNIVIKPEVRNVLCQQVMVHGRPTGLRIQKLLQKAREVQTWWSFEDEDREAVFVAMFMHGIDYWLSPCFQDGVSIKGYVREIVTPELRMVDRNNPRAGETLRLCMGWANDDDESMFSEQMERRMRMAASVLDLRDF